MTNVAQKELTGAQAMTLAAIAATAATPRPSGESLQGQGQRMLRGMWTHLNDPSLDTGGLWRVVWLGLGPDNANMAYIAQNLDGSNQFAVVVRGTVGSLTDMMEDLDVGTVVPFTDGGSPTEISVAAGAMAAFTQVVTAGGIVGTPAQQELEDAAGAPELAIPSGATLTGALAALLSVAPSTPRPTVYVTGHSLGGCVATMLATYLQAQTWAPSDPQFALVTFAAPTAGPGSFAGYVDHRPWSPYATYANEYDLIPRAWWDLEEPKKDDWYPNPGPKADEQVKILLTQLDKLRKGNVYVQPNAKKTVMLNPHYHTHDPVHVHKTTDDFMAQVAYQHANNTYLALLGGNPVPGGPVVTSLSTTAGRGGTPVVIYGSGFSSESVVDYGPIPCTEITVDPSGEMITTTAPVGLGVVDIRVTNDLGTSPAVPLGKFAYGGPAPLVVTGIDKPEGKGGDPVTIHGSGFVQGATVQFGDIAVDVDQIHVQSPTEIDTTVPSRSSTADPGTAGLPKTVNVTVTTGEITSPTSAADEFSYTL
jgi:hypothetical protein